MKNKINTITILIILFVSVGIGTFICNVLDRTEINIWLARGIGALVTVVGFQLCKRKSDSYWDIYTRGRNGN